MLQQVSHVDLHIEPNENRQSNKNKKKMKNIKLRTFFFKKKTIGNLIAIVVEEFGEVTDGIEAALWLSHEIIHRITCQNRKQDR